MEKTYYFNKKNSIVINYDYFLEKLLKYKQPTGNKLVKIIIKYLVDNCYYLYGLYACDRIAVQASNDIIDYYNRRS